MPKSVKKEISLRMQVRRQHASLFLGPAWEKISNDPYFCNETIHLYGPVLGPKGYKYSTGAIEVYPHSGLARAKQRVDDFGFIGFQRPAIMARVYWPSDAFANLQALVANMRLAEASISYDTAQAITRCGFYTLNEELRNEEGMYWVSGAGPQPFPRIYTYSDVG